MSKVCHGSLDIVECPEIRTPNRSLDYGAGFYVTTSFAQAERWVRRKMKEGGIKHGFVNEYELNEETAKTMNVLFFDTPTEDWVNFVMRNRTQRGFQHNYDIVYGPVADDSVYTQFTLFEGGFISMPTLIMELKTYKLVDQYLFHNEHSLKALKFANAKEIEL